MILLAALLVGADKGESNGAAETGKTTPIRESRFSVLLPGPWTPIEDEDPALFSYESSRTDERLTVTIELTHPPAPRGELDSIYARHRGKRLQAESETGEINVKYGAVQRARGAVIGSYLGHHADTARRFAALTIVRLDLVASFFLEDVNPSEEEFEARFHTIAASVLLPRPIKAPRPTQPPAPQSPPAPQPTD